MIKIYQKRLNDTELHEVNEFKTGCWINAQDISEKEIVDLEERYKVDANVLKDVLDPYESTRIEISDGVIYIFVRAPQGLDDKIVTEPLLIIVGSDFIMTLSKTKIEALKRFEDNKINFTTTQKTQLVIRFFSEIMRLYNFSIMGINKDIRGVSRRFSRINEKIIINFVAIEEVLNDFLLALTHTKPVLQNILGGKVIKLYEADQELTEDLVLNTDQLMELCRSNLKHIVTVREAYSAILTNDLNKVIKLFTALTVVLTIPTIVASLYGMNVFLPFGENPYMFWIIIMAIIGVISFVLYIFNRNRWL